MFQHENYDISEMREYLCTKFCSFVWKTTVQKCAALCCIYLTYAKLMETQTNFRNEFCNCTEGWRYKSKLNRAPSTTFVTTSMWHRYFV